MPTRGITDAEISQRLQDALRKRMRKRGDRAAWLRETAKAVGVNRRSIVNWLEGKSVPRAWHFMNLLEHFGVDLANETMGTLTGFKYFRRDDPEGMAIANAARVIGRVREVAPMLCEIANELEEAERALNAAHKVERKLHQIYDEKNEGR